MSGIYAKGMEMPTTGLYFVSVDNTGGKDKPVVTVERMLGNRDVRTIIGAYELIPVPDHGRLIDADALKQRAERGTDEHGRPCMLIKLGYVNTMPTIIPADNGDTTQSNTSNALDALGKGDK